MRDRARAVIIGGGITGCSVAYHLARAGWSDLILLDKGALTSGSTCHAAGLVTQFNPSPTMMRFRRYSIELYRELGVFETVGSVRIASSPESLGELQRGVSRARAIGLDVELASPAETLRLLPQAIPRVALRLGVPAGRRQPRPALGDLRAGGRGARAGRRDPYGRARDRHRARPASRGARRAHRDGPDRDRGRRSTPPACGRRRWLPWPAPTWSRPRSSTSTSRWRPSPGTSCRTTCPASATPTTSSTASPRRAACSSAATSTIPWRAGSTACRGSTAGRRCRPTRRASRRSCRAPRGASRSSPTRASSSSSATPTP